MAGFPGGAGFFFAVTLMAILIPFHYDLAFFCHGERSRSECDDER